MDPDKAEAQRIRALLEELEAEGPVDSDDSGEGVFCKKYHDIESELEGRYKWSKGRGEN